MSIALYPTGQLRFWTESEISLREGIIPRLLYAVKNPLLCLNKGWRFERVEGPSLTPISYLSSAYTTEDVWATNGQTAGEAVVMRAETTVSSYSYARYLFGRPANLFVEKKARVHLLPVFVSLSSTSKNSSASIARPLEPITRHP